jgi:hypothetical protein
VAGVEDGSSRSLADGHGQVAVWWREVLSDAMKRWSRRRPWIGRKHLAVDSRHIYTSEAERAMASIDTEVEPASTSTRIQVECTVVAVVN